jgi:hypothetical protein
MSDDDEVVDGFIDPTAETESVEGFSARVIHPFDGVLASRSLQAI